MDDQDACNDLQHSGPRKACKEAAAKMSLNLFVFQQRGGDMSVWPRGGGAQAQSMSEQQGRALHHAKRQAHRRFQGGSLPRRDRTLSRKMVIRGLAPYRGGPATPGPRHRSQSGLRSQTGLSQNPASRPKGPGVRDTERAADRPRHRHHHRQFRGYYFLRGSFHESFFSE